MGGSIHVWGGITRHNRTRLVVFNRNVNANVYVNEVLANTVVPFMHDNFPEKNGILQQDGAGPHTARVTQQFITDNNISLLNWASMSPDMSPIVWDELKIRVYTRPHPPVNEQQLEQEWNAIDLSTARPKWRIDGPVLSGHLLYSLVNYAYANPFHHRDNWSVIL